jgi:geranylgeranyl diphosphate synthase type I
MSLTIAEFAQNFQKDFKDLIANKTSGLQEFYRSEAVEALFEQAISVAIGGKTVRPYLAELAYRGAGGTGDIKSVGQAIELFHAFCLMHDDIIDGDDKRRGAETVHSFARGMYSDSSNHAMHERSSIGQAILIGDLYLSWVYELLYTNHVFTASESAKRMFFYTVEEVVMGQMLDVHLTMQSEVQTSEILDKIRLKTAGYTFIRPLAIGYLLAGHDEVPKELNQLGLHLGMAFQVQDDLLDIRGDESITGKPVGSDIEDCQHTLLTQYIFESGSPEDQKLLKALMGKSEEASTDLLHALFEKSGAINYAEQEILAHFTEARKQLRNLNLAESEKRSLAKLIDYVEARTH